MHPPEALDGLLNLHKPPGRTSFQMVALVRRWSGQRRVGHGGTLDPLASGVLVLGLGQGTRVLEYLTRERKTYRAEVELGASTDTYDGEGQVVPQGDPSRLGSEELETALARFRGSFLQTPPPFSALKYAGRPLYRWAREGVAVPLKPRSVQIFRLELLSFQSPLLALEVECGQGTYIRSLAHDLGQTLGCGAYLKSLVRLQSGPFRLEDSVTPPQVEEAFGQGRGRSLLHPIDRALLSLGAVSLGPEGERAVQAGRPISLELREASPEELRRAYSQEGRLLGLLRFKGGLWWPRKVFPAEEREETSPES